MSGASFFLKCLEPGAGLPPPTPVSLTLARLCWPSRGS